MSLSAGHRLGAYEILSPLGAGGMGEVFRARDLRLDRDVAVKIVVNEKGNPLGKLHHGVYAGFFEQVFHRILQVLLIARQMRVG